MKGLKVLVLIIFSISSSFGQDLIPRDKLFDTSDRKEMFQISNDGRWVFYIKDIYNFKPTLYFINVSNPTQELSFTFESPIAEYNVLDDFILVRLGAPSGQKLVAFYPEQSKVRELNLPQIKQTKVYGTKDNSVAAILVADGLESGLYHINAETSQYDLIRKAEGFASYKFDKDLIPIAAEKPNDQAGKSFYYLRNNEWIQFREYPWDVGMTVRGVQNILTVSSDGRYVYFTDNQKSDITNLIELDTQTGKERIVFNDAISDIMPVGYVLDREQKLLSVISQYGQSRHYPLSSQVKADFDYLLNKIKELHILNWTPDHKFWLVESMNGGANEYFIYDRSSKVLKFLFNDHPFLDDFLKNIRHTYEVKSFDGTKLPINLYLREDLDKDKNGIPDSPIPAVVYVHGGPWIGWQNNNWLITRNLQLLANRGYAVVYAEFRGAATLGKAFVNKAKFEWGVGMVKDKASIADWLVEQGIARKDQIGIFGWSYGGYAAMAGLAFSNKYACGISMYGISDLDRFLRTDHANYPVWWDMVADIKSSKGVALAKKHSPLYSVDGINEPLLLSTGGQDRRIAPNQSQLMADSLSAKGVNVGYLFYPNEGHDYRLPVSWASFWGYGERFLNQYLGGDFEPYTEPKDVNYNVIYKPGFHELQGIWEGPEELKFSIVQQNASYRAIVTSPGKVKSIIKTGDELFSVKATEDDRYSGSFYRIYEDGTKRSENCTFQLKGETLNSSFNVIYKRIKS